MRKTGFTMVELLVVIAIIATLVSILVPATQAVRRQGMALVCTSNLRQMAIAATVYTSENREFFPPAIVYHIQGGQTQKIETWDYTTTNSNGQMTSSPGLLWQGNSTAKIQQCPSYEGDANWMDDPYTGYNYNASFIGGGARFVDGVRIDMVQSTRLTKIKKPAYTAVFGDGHYTDGTNKFMRSPLPGKFDRSLSPETRAAGTQGFRHNGRTNIAWADGAVSSAEPAGETAPDHLSGAQTGFLSIDNSAYDTD